MLIAMTVKLGLMGGGLWWMGGLEGGKVGKGCWGKGCLKRGGR